ncbi:hypothetical protein [Clostridium scatologenes]|uniref:Uncharacterized protein n=1 Tax=Clostridium scatologenes TaxID=1548 RepID=A0A0E3GR74_CLOSL|nr:hypothetical protein [Clostridium scatologenes]AKA69826.1 hypothetical protein CSCA_2701 [Clostridium scatologenes]
MIFLGNLTKISDTKYSVGYTHYKPLDEINGLKKSKEQLEQEGILVDSILEPQQIEGKQAVMYWNPVDKVIFYEYEDIQKSKEVTEKETFTQTLAQLAIENKKKDTMIKQLVQTVNDLTIKVNKLGGTV